MTLTDAERMSKSKQAVYTTHAANKDPKLVTYSKAPTLALALRLWPLICGQIIDTNITHKSYCYTVYDWIIESYF